MDEIKCIFFSEFHPTAGPKIVYQIPEGYISKEVFDSLHVFVITKRELQNRIINTNASNHRIVGCPVCIDNPKYARNELIFNLCLVFDESTETGKYEEVVKKLASYLKTLELEGGFLSKEENRAQLPCIMGDILEELNHHGSCYIPIGSSTTLHLKVTSGVISPSSVKHHDVPIFDPKVQRSVAAWDLATQQLLPYIDGFKHVAKIAAEADMDISIVKASLQNLVYYGVIKMISIFQYGNVYVTTPEVNELTENKELEAECRLFVACASYVPSLRDVMMLYCGLTAGTTVRDLCARQNPSAVRIDERKLIQFGLMRRLIRRVHKFPVKLPSEAGSSRLRDLYRWFNGNTTCDEICCETGLTQTELDDKIDTDPSIVMCWK